MYAEGSPFYQLVVDNLPQLPGADVSLTLFSREDGLRCTAMHLPSPPAAPAHSCHPSLAHLNTDRFPQALTNAPP